MVVPVQTAALNLLRDFGVFAIGAGLLAYVARLTIKQYFDKQLQSYQTELDKEAVKFTDLHQKRAEVIGEFYVKLAEFDQDMRALVDPMLSRGETSREEKIEIAAESGEELRRFYLKNKIYFSSYVCETMDELLGEYRDMFHDFSVAKIHDAEKSLSESDERIEKWQSNWESLTEAEVPELRDELQSQFRDLLGVS
ncbi:hypothetical protein E6P09_19000 (plasmid) [Haloferax mediterranei ATCC 33500]|uniref:Uncharacterized protein n=1 Tax=Haloferax mediterranei (strain ATCC 33500 / DSM 1411 / JCM 8866 / NBRC 14739 / NCIMB 2177 / R-4) TaxID=523841 RepID=I3R917_HALMT|nr:hypothetical protein [Haloferax mediterranei]AFK20727.1 hypothetical protein HFX_4032 [Haloferax mediterranei ATCC 33500]AHZ24018.1 hypothetical protein BM92_19645 [Haloferax mediterranei ATCC 33500]ELZ97603.1 hypothetical protein C439_16843 [Haloferax mediterranei ATCC 33500]MDX5989692.1 hypothetical protein [Haloferax mediterranei ATCC 33500]QCQ77407.1 hypothetical protein E6P09_19000 [Haloferax mediterranei ATCC 33500]